MNDPPDAVNDAITVAEDSAATAVDVLANDTVAPDTGETLTVTAVTQPATGGTVTLVGGTVSFTPEPDFNGITTFTYTISDGNGGTDTATVTVTVTSVNDPPTAVDDVFTVQDNYPAPIEPTSSMLFSLYGITDFVVQYFDGIQWAAVLNGTVSGSRMSFTSDDAEELNEPDSVDIAAANTAPSTIPRTPAGRWFTRKSVNTASALANGWAGGCCV